MTKKQARTTDFTSEEPFAQLRLLFTDEVQTRYEVARPLLLQQHTLVVDRPRETQTHPQLSASSPYRHLQGTLIKTGALPPLARAHG